MPWAVVLFLLPLVLIATVARRAIRVVRLLRNPEQLRSLFSDGFRAAIVDAGLDPDTVTLEEIQGSPELSGLAAADLRRALQSSILGFRPAGSRSSAPALRVRTGDRDPVLLPGPIDAPPGAPLRILALGVIAGLVALAIFFELARP